MSMRLRGFIPLSLVIAVGALMFAPAAFAQVCGGTGTSASAINQYCETFPTSRGPRAPRNGSQQLSSTLPSQVVHQLSGSGATGSSAGPGTTPTSASAAGSATTGSKPGARHRASKAARERRLLLTLPAVHVTPAHFKAAVTSVWAPYSWLLIVLAGIGVALVALAVGVSRRDRAGETRD
jgi:hypothetical protein